MNAAAPLIHVVDDDESFRGSLLRLLHAAGLEAQGYATADDYLRTDATARPGCVVLDVHLAGVSGLDLQATLAGWTEALPIIFLTGYGDIPMSVQAMKAGAVDFLTKPVQRQALLAAVQNALVRDADRRAAQQQAAALRSRFASLTPREREVFALVVAGKLNKQIAATLGTAERTVKAHRAQVMEKMGVASLAELARLAEHLEPGSGFR